MREDVLILLLHDTNRENVRFGTVEVSFIFYDARVTNCELIIHCRRNINSLSKSSVHH